MSLRRAYTIVTMLINNRFRTYYYYQHNERWSIERIYGWKKKKSSEVRYYLFCIEGKKEEKIQWSQVLFILHRGKKRRKKVSISVLLFDENNECIDGWMDGLMNHYEKRRKMVQIQKRIRPDQSFICFWWSHDLFVSTSSLLAVWACSPSKLLVVNLRNNHCEKIIYLNCCSFILFFELRIITFSDCITSAGGLQFDLYACSGGCIVIWNGVRCMLGS